MRLISCPECEPNVCLDCDKISLVSPDTSIGITKSVIDGVCTFSLKVLASFLLVTEDTNTIAFTGRGSEAEPLTASLKISSNSDNILQVDSTGLLVLSPTIAETANSKVDTETANVTLSGTLSRKIQVDVKVSETINNYLTILADGLYVPTPVFSGGLTQVNVIDSVSINFSGAGTSSTPLSATVNISADANNALEVRANGLYVANANYTFQNGLTSDVMTNTVSLGGPLLSDTTIDMDTFNLKLNDGRLGLNITGVPTRRLSIGHDLGTSTSGTLFLYATDNGSAFIDTSNNVNLSIRAGNTIQLLPDLDTASGWLQVSDPHSGYVRLSFLSSGGTAHLGQIGLRILDAGTNLREFYFNTVDGSGTTEMTFYRNMRFMDISQDNTTTKVLTLDSTNNRVRWRDAISIARLSGITAAVATNTIDNDSYLQEWQWNSISGNNGFKISSNSPNVAANTTLFDLAFSGANTTGSIITRALRISNTRTGASPTTNYGIEIAVSGGTVNEAIYVSAGRVNMQGGSITRGLLSLINLVSGSDRTGNITMGNASHLNAMQLSLASPLNSSITPFVLLASSNVATLNGFGTGVYFSAQNGIAPPSAVQRIIGAIDIFYSDVSDSTEDATFRLRTITTGTLSQKLQITSDGLWTLGTYGAGTHSGTLTYYLAVDVNGNLIEVASGGGGGATLADGDYGDITVSGAGTSLTVDNGAINDAKISDVDWGKITGTPTTLGGYGITDAQPLDADLTAIAGLTPVNDDIIQRKAGAWINRTMAQLKTDLVLTKSDVGLSNVENTALSTWAGSTNITTLGTIGTGVWQGTAIGDTYISSAATWNAKLSTLTVNDTTITGGVAGRIFFESAANELSQSAKLSWDEANSRLTIDNGANAITGGVDALLYTDIGVGSYAAEFKGNGSYTGFLVTNADAGGAPFVQLHNSANAKYWTMMLETDDDFAIREGGAAGTQVLWLTPGGDLHHAGNIYAPADQYSSGGYTVLVKNDSNNKFEYIIPDVITQNSQSGTTYILALSDKGKTVDITNAASIALTIPTNASVAFPVGTILYVEQGGAGQITISGDTGVTVNSRGGAFITAGQYAKVTLEKKATNTWVIYGDLTT